MLLNNKMSQCNNYSQKSSPHLSQLDIDMKEIIAGSNIVIFVAL